MSQSYKSRVYNVNDFECDRIYGNYSACPTHERAQNILEQSSRGAKSMSSTRSALRLSLLCASVKHQILIVSDQ